MARSPIAQMFSAVEKENNAQMKFGRTRKPIAASSTGTKPAATATVFRPPLVMATGRPRVATATVFRPPLVMATGRPRAASATVLKPEDVVQIGDRCYRVSDIADRLRAAESKDDLLRYEFGKNLKVDWCYETDDALFIRLVSTSESAVCPYCGEISTHHHGREIRYLQDFYMGKGKKCYIKLVLFRYSCGNHEVLDCVGHPKCEHRTFVEDIELAAKYATRTLSTEAMLLEMGITCSFRAVAATMGRLGMAINHCSVARLITSIYIDIVHRIVRIGVDDVCKRKGMSYYTIIYDAVTHMCLALMDGRDGVSFAKWLEQHPNVEQVMRDRASAFAEAIERVLGDTVMQVADKFHLFQNLNKHLQDVLYEQIPAKFRVFVKFETGPDGKITTGSILDEAPAKIYFIPTPEDNRLMAMKYDCEAPVNPDGTPVLYNFLITSRSSKADEAAAKKREEKKQTAYAVRTYCAQLQAEGGKIDYRRIESQFGVSPHVAKKYLSMTEDEVEMITDPPKSRKTEPISPYIHMIYRMLSDNRSAWDIYRYIYFYTDFCKGLVGHELESAQNRLLSYINAVIRNNFPGRLELKLGQYAKCRYPADIVYYTRTDISRHLLTTNPDTWRDKRLDLILPQLLKDFPVITAVHECAENFRDVMNGTDPDKLDDWISKYSNLLPTFCNGLKQDIEPVKNGIRTQETSGFVEGSNCAFKLVKRIGCGRYTTKCLRIKVTLFLARKRGFNPYEIVKFRRLAI